MRKFRYISAVIQLLLLLSFGILFFNGDSRYIRHFKIMEYRFNLTYFIFYIYAFTQYIHLVIHFIYSILILRKISFFRLVYIISALIFLLLHFRIINTDIDKDILFLPGIAFTGFSIFILIFTFRNLSREKNKTVTLEESAEILDYINDAK